MLDVLAVDFAVFHYDRTKRHSAGTFQECITAMIRMVMFVLLLLCGDIESNPGPDEHQPEVFRLWSCHPRRCCCCFTRRRPLEFESPPPVVSLEVIVVNVNDGQAQRFCERDQQRVPACPSIPPPMVKDRDSRQMKVHKIERMDTNKKIGTCSSTLDILWCEVCSQWDDVTIDDFKLTEADGTELVDDVYYQQLATEIPLQLRLKTKGKKSRSTSYARVHARPLTDDVIHEIATDHINHDIVKLGLAMGFTQQRISKYKAENATEPRAESRGTENMIMYWRQRCGDVDQVGAFCNVLQQAELNELADDLSNDEKTSSISSPNTTAIPATTTRHTNTSTQDSNTDRRSSGANDDFDDILRDIAKALYRNSDINDLGKALGYEPADVGRSIIENANQGQNYMGTLNLLRMWRNTQTRSTEKAALRSVLLEARFNNVADKYLLPADGAF